MSNKAKPPKPAPAAPQIQIQLAGLGQQLNAGNPAALITALEQVRESRVLCLVYNETLAEPAQLSFAVLPPFEHALRDIERTPKLDVFLRCLGGQTEIPWRLVSLLREYTDDLGVIVSKYALSGGCHIAIAGDDLLMTAFSALGSVDPTRKHPLLPKDADGKPIPTSVQDLKHCVEFISEQLGDQHQSQDLAQIISELFKYVEPLPLGALEQAYKLARLITEKVLKTRRAPLDQAIIDKVVDMLSGKYYSHSFLISRNDVEQDLGLAVIRPDAAHTAAIEQLGNFYDTQFAAINRLMPPADAPHIRAGAFIHTSRVGWVEAQLVDGGGELKADLWQRYI
jgi:Serine dehydrogenase proteinase